MKAVKAVTTIVLDSFSQAPLWIEDENGNIITKDVIKERASELMEDGDLSLLEICLKIVQEYNIYILLPNGDSIKADPDMPNFELHPNGGIQL